MSYSELLQVEFASDREFCARILNGWDIFDKYYSKSDESPLYAGALILHPARRIKYIQANWRKSWKKPALLKVKKLWEEYQQIAPNYTVVQSDERNTQDVNDFDRIAQDLGKFARPASQDEYEDYDSESPYETRTSALTWWCQDQQQKRWPRLSYMTIDILSISAMSDEPERVFSGVCRTISWERAQLSAENIERIVLKELAQEWDCRGKILVNS